MSYKNDVDAETISDAFQYGGHSYQLVRVYNISGNDIISFCYNSSGYLSHINDELENEFIASTIGALGYDIVYFGYSDEQSEGNWYWTDGESSSFVNWRSGEPNNERGEEHYALISPDGTWNDGKLERDSQSGAVILCEWNTLIETDTSAPHLSDYQSHIINITSSSHLILRIKHMEIKHMSTLQRKHLIIICQHAGAKAWMDMVLENQLLFLLMMNMK